MIFVLAQETTSPPTVGERFPVLMVVSVASAAVLGGLWLLRRWSRIPPEGSYCSPKHLWRELCRAHQLSRSQIRLLQRIATRGQLDVPCELFVESTHLKRAAQTAEFSRYREQIATITAHLFGTSQ